MFILTSHKILKALFDRNLTAHIRTQKPSLQSQTLKVPPVVAHQSTLWSALGEIDTPIVKNKVSTKIKSHGVPPVIGSEATLWSPLGGN